MEEALKKAIQATVEVVNARLNATNNANYMAALLLAQNARDGPIVDTYLMAEDGFENSYENQTYYKAAMNVADVLSSIVFAQEELLDQALAGIAPEGVDEEDYNFAEQFSQLWNIWKEEATKQIAKMKAIVVLDQTPLDYE